MMALVASRHIAHAAKMAGYIKKNFVLLLPVIDPMPIASLKHCQRSFAFTIVLHSPYTLPSTAPCSTLQILHNLVLCRVGSLDDMEASLRDMGLSVSSSLFLEFINSLKNSNDSPTTTINSRRLVRFFFWCRQQQSGEEGFGDEAFNHIIRVLAEMKDITALRTVIRDLQREGKQMEPATFALAIESLVNSGMPKEAVRLFRSMEKHQLLPLLRDDGWSSVSATIHALCAKGHARKAKGVFWHNKEKLGVALASASVIINRSILHGWCVQGNVHEARKVLDQMKSEGHPVNLVSYNDLLRCICKRNLCLNPSALVSETTDLMMEMRSSGVSPTTSSYNILLSCLGKTRRVKEACCILESLIRGEVDCSPDWVSYYLVVRVLYLTGRFVRGNMLVDCMIRGRTMPSLRFYHGLIGVLCGIEKVDYALKMFDQMKQFYGASSIRPTYDLLITKLCRNGKFEIGKCLWDEAVERGISPQCSSDLLDPLKTEVFKPMKPLKKLNPAEYKKLVLRSKGVLRLKQKPRRKKSAAST